VQDRPRSAIAAEATELAVASGKTLTTQCDRGREFVVIADERPMSRGGGDLIAQLGPGDFVGEIALISGEPRTAASDNDFTGV
jgi:CRP-like cAMP-binding protein